MTLTHWGRDTITTISQTTFSNAFSWMKMYEFYIDFSLKNQINNISALVQVMAWCRPGDTPLSEVYWHICVTGQPWVNSLRPGEAYICVSKLASIISDNGLSPGRHQAIIWTNAGILLIGPLGTNVSEILIEIHTFSFKKMHFKMSSGKWRPFCLGLNVLINDIM